MKKPFLLAFGLFFIASFAAFTTHAAPTIDADRVIAVVNNEAITNYDLNTRLDNARENLKKQNIALPSPEELKRQVLERLIMDKLQLQAATEAGITVGDSDLDAAMRRIANSNHLTLDAFKAALEKDNIPWAKFREEVRQQIIMARIRDREVDSRVTISDAEIDNYLNSAEARGDNAEYLISHIIVRLPEQAGPEQIAKLRAKIEEAQRRLQQGEDFAKVAAAYSDSPDAMSGGSIGVRTRDQLPPLYADAVAKMKPGEVSGILRSAVGFHLVKLMDKHGGKLVAQSTQQTHVRHILIKTNELVSDADAKRRIDEIKAKLNAGADFAALAKQYSDDTSAGNGGDLGWLDQGTTVPEFEKAMDALPVSKVSEPVKTQFGWHLIEVLGRRNTSNDPTQLRLAARQTLRERRADEAYQDWLRQLRDNAYIEYHLDDQ